MEELEAIFPDEEQGVAAVVIEPLIQGAAGMRLWPAGHFGGGAEVVRPHRRAS